LSGRERDERAIVRERERERESKKERKTQGGREKDRVRERAAIFATHGTTLV
jgi:hypothetical protein